jgi:hypothetical protein
MTSPETGEVDKRQTRQGALTGGQEKGEAMKISILYTLFLSPVWTEEGSLWLVHSACGGYIAKYIW